MQATEGNRLAMAGVGAVPAWNIGVQRRDRSAWTALQKLLEADVGVLQLTRVELEEVLKQLLNVSLPNARIRGEEIAAVITALVKILPLNSELLCSEFTRFVQKACLKEKVLFTSDQLELVMKFFLNFIKVCSSWYTANSIRALGIVLHDNADRASHELELLFAVLTKHLDPSGVDIEARYAATSCVSNICAQAEKTPEIYHFFSSLLRMVVENFRQQVFSLVNGDTQSILVRACTCSMKCIYTIINSNHHRLEDRINAVLPSLLSSMRQVLGFGLSLQPDDDRIVYQDEIPVSDSDSSVCGSDAGSTNGISIGEGLLARLRMTVLCTLEVIARFLPKSITSSIGLYLPEQTTPYMTLYGNTPSVLTLLIADPCEKARLAAAKFLETMWSQIPLKQYFRHVPSSPTAQAATSIASMPKRISLMLYQVHFTLVYCIQHERDNGSLIPIVKTTMAIVQRFPYLSVAKILAKSELSPSLDDLVKALASSLYNVASTSDHSLRITSLSCLSALLNIQDTLPPLLEWMVVTNSGARLLEGAQITIAGGTHLLRKRTFVEEMVRIASQADEPGRTLLRLEAISLLGKVAKNYAPALSANWTKLANFMLVGFRDVDPNVRLQAVKILENYIKGESTSQLAADAGMCSTAAGGSTQETSIDPYMSNTISQARRECLAFLGAHLIPAFHDTSHHVRACVCQCFTLLSPTDWDRLLEMRISILATKRLVGTADTYTTIFLQTPRDISPVVRAAGFRLLGSLCLAPAFKKRELSCAVAGLALDALADTTLNVRVRAAWALGNVCTTQGPESVACAVQPNGTSSDQGFKSLVLYDLLPPAQIRRIIEKMLAYVNDNDKVVSSIARTLGLVCRWISFEPFAKTLSSRDDADLRYLLAQAMTVLSAKIHDGSPKVRWNACHAIAKVLLCPGLPLASVTWAPAVFQALLKAVEQQENFKVRISACTALRVSRSRSAYGSFFKSSLFVVLDALETASDLKDVTEFRYKEQLETQLSFTLIHLIDIAAEEDDRLIWNALRKKPTDFLYDWLLHNLHRMCTLIEGDETQAGDDTGDNDDAGGGGSGDVHDVHPVKKEELLSAVRSLLRMLQRLDKEKLYSPSCESLLYDTKLTLERDVLESLDSREDTSIPFEF